jgi:hypothetical protein
MPLIAFVELVGGPLVARHSETEFDNPPSTKEVSAQASFVTAEQQLLPALSQVD